MKNESLYELGKKAQKGDEIALLKIINQKRKMIEKYSYCDEDRYQYIVERLIIGIKKYIQKKLAKNIKYQKYV